MAIQFPNFLGQILKNDYSGLGDAISNYYAGKDMPRNDLLRQIQAEFARPNAQNDALIRQIQAEFARPTAETNLANAKISGAHEKLTSKHLQMQMEQLRRQMAEQAQMEALISRAMQQGNPEQQSMNAQPRSASPAMPPVAAMRAALAENPNVMPAQPEGAMQGFNPEKMDRRFQRFDQGEAGAQNPSASAMLHGLPRSAFHGGEEMKQLAPLIAQNMQPQTAQQPPATLAPAGEPLKINGVAPEQTPAIMAAAPASNSNENIVNKGSPNLYGIDALYDQNPLARDYLEKKGFKKKVETKFNAKTGATNILTTYPSGKITLETTTPPGVVKDGIPLTNAMVTQHQKVIAGVDSALPIIQEILKKPETFAGKYIQQYPRSSGLVGMGYLPGLGDLSNKYENQVNAAVDSLINAYGLNKSDKSTEMVHGQVLIGHNESDSAYKRRLKDLVKDLERRKAYSENQVKESNKINPIANAASSSSDDISAMSDEQLQEIANG